MVFIKQVPVNASLTNYCHFLLGATLQGDGTKYIYLACLAL